MKRSSFSTVALQIAVCSLSFAMLQCNSTPSENATETLVTEPSTTVQTTTTQVDSPAVAETTVTTPEAAQPAPQPEPATKTQPATPATKPKDSEPIATKPTAKKTPSKKSAQKAKTVETAPSKPTTPVQTESPASPSAPPVVTKTETAPPPPVTKANKTPVPSSPVTNSTPVGYKSVKAVIHGTSSLHDWDSKITKIACTGTLQTKDNVPTALKDIEIKIEVKGIKSKEGKKMDDKTFETFKSDKNPYIIFSFDNAPIKMGASDAVTIEATGNLSMAGATKSVTLTATGKLLPNGDLQLSTSKKIKMTEYSMTPPEMMLGTIKVGNEVTVSFDFVLEKG